MSQHEPFKTKLETELEKITAELSGIAEQNSETGDWVAVPLTTEMGDADENVQADMVEEWNERRALVAQLETRYRNIIRALKKIEGGTYGTCEISGEPIETERLEANPAARTTLANADREKELPL